jgi:trigger factor
MKIDVDEIGPVERRVRVELPADRVGDELSRAYQDLGRRVRIKGFRAGKVPRSVLQGLYGEEIKGQVQSQLVEDSLGQVLKERGLQIVSRPEVEANPLQEGEAFSFSAIFEVKPDIELKNYLGLELQKVNLSVTDDQVDEALKRVQESHARLEPIEDRNVVQKGDFVTLDFDGRIAGKTFRGGKNENYVMEVGASQALPEFDEGVAGLKVGEESEIKVPFPEDHPNREVAGQTVEFKVVARGIKRKLLPALDDEFAKDQGEFGSLDELRDAIRKRLEEELKQIQNEALKDQLIARLLEAHPFTPPRAMVERHIRYLIERQQKTGQSQVESAATTDETRKALEGRASRQVQATLLIEKIARTEKIDVSDKEVQERIDSIARAAGDRGKTVREYYSKPELREELRSQMVFDRTLNFLLERATIKELDSARVKVDEQTEKR